MHARQEMPQNKPGVETEELVQSRDEERSASALARDDDCVKSLLNIVSRSRMRSLATSGEEDCKLKVSCQMEGEVELVDADILSTPSSRRCRGQVKNYNV